MFIDSHCHIDFPEDFPEGPAPLLERMRATSVTHALCVNVVWPDFPRVLGLAQAHANLYASCGVHPDYVDTYEPTVAQLVQGAANSKVVAIGETGLDYFRLTGDLEWQRERFRTHIRAARGCKKPLIIHTRQAREDTIRLMREEGAEQVGGVMHCFTEDWATAKAALDLGFYISFSGIVSFKTAADLRAVAKQVPLDRLLIETDSPYLAPVPFRGKRNEPSFVPHVAACLSTVLNLPIEQVGQQTSTNFHRLFNTL
jgi:TatD DNase family protein